MSNNDRENSVNLTPNAQTEEEIKAYWTKERQAEAQPIPMPMVEAPIKKKQTIVEPKKPSV